MFENIYGQEKVISLLQNDLTRKSLSNSMIFHGGQSTGKLTTALTLVRLMNCTGDGSIDCKCEHCRQVRSLSFEGMVFFSRRNFSYYVHALVSSFNATFDMKYFNRILWYMKLMFASLDDNFVSGVISDADLKNIHEMQAKTYVILQDNYDAYRSIKTMENATRQKMLDDLAKLVGFCQDVFAMYKKPSIPVDMIRNALDWSYINLAGINRVIIIDGADYLDDSSRNTLLKRLEEPSPNLFFILLATNKNRIIKTILSRCRCYYFQDRSAGATADVLLNVFGEKNQYDSVEHFLLKDDKTAFYNMIPEMSKVVSYIFNVHHSFSELESFLQTNNDKTYIKALLKNLSILVDEEILRRSLGKQPQYNIEMLSQISIGDLQTFKTLLDKTALKMDIYNLTPIWTVEGLFYPIKTLVNMGRISC